MSRLSFLSGSDGWAAGHAGLSYTEVFSLEMCSRQKPAGELKGSCGSDPGGGIFRTWSGQLRAGWPAWVPGEGEGGCHMSDEGRSSNEERCVGERGVQRVTKVPQMEAGTYWRQRWDDTGLGLALMALEFGRRVT